MSSEPDKPAKAAPDRNRNPMVLLVDDETSVLELCKRILERAGFRVLCTDDPRRAVELFQENEDGIALLVSDVVMPEMSGPELADTLVEINPQLKVLFISGVVPSAAPVFAALRHQFPFRFLRKPFSPGLLVEFLRDMLSAGAATG